MLSSNKHLFVGNLSFCDLIRNKKLRTNEYNQGAFTALSLRAIAGYETDPGALRKS